MTKLQAISIPSSPEDEAAVVPSSHKLSARYAAENSPSVERKKRKRSKRRNQTPDSPTPSKKTKLKIHPSGSKYRKQDSPKPMTPSPLASFPRPHNPNHPFMKISTIRPEHGEPVATIETDDIVETGATVDAGSTDSDDMPMAIRSRRRNPFADQTYEAPEQLIEDRASPDLGTQPIQKLEPSSYVPGKETLGDDDNCYISKAAFNLLTDRHMTLQHMVKTFIDSVNDLETTSKGDRDIRDGILAEAKSLQMGIKAVSNAVFELPYANRTGAATRAAAGKTLAAIEKFNEKKRILAEGKAATAAQQAEIEEARIAEAVSNDDSSVQRNLGDEEEVDISQEQAAGTDGEPMDESE
ncbi:hypothetical protein HER10_EVM0010593 [Colletotrichum scovillei]|uniref:uncharacterized protein n=1 Tax=Colletotrichum scovillei TaxID=1209932 RepID=UPI0015C3E2DA|nr:uncharacterized protein HER10_EVM0010593 [Colletotrichum scovillei]KAF4781340.1 hypothetical protein HER10_EVM0010593 [Colletotrichum scovillei]